MASVKKGSQGISKAELATKITDFLSVPEQGNSMIALGMGYSCQLQIGTYQWLNNNNKGTCHLPLESEPCATAAAHLQHPLRGIQCGEWGTLCPRETGETGLLDSYFQELISWSHFLHLLISRKTLNPFWWCQLLLLTSRKPFIKWVLDCTELPLHQNLIFRLSPLPLWSSFSDLSEGLSPGLQSKFCPK